MMPTTETHKRAGRGKWLKAACAALTLVSLGLLAWGLFQEWGRKPGGFHNLVYRDEEGRQSRYVVFVPHGYSGWKRYPVILFLHGWGERGTDGLKQTSVGLPPAIRWREYQFGFLAVFPQGKEGKWEAGSEETRLALDILADVGKSYRVDTKRVYLTGISNGGTATWNLAARYPEKWAAIVPVAATGDPKLAPKIKHIPCWCFHSSNDRATPVEIERRMIEALRAAGGNPRFEEAPGVEINNHNVWDRAYRKPELYDWLLQQHLP